MERGALDRTEDVQGQDIVFALQQGTADGERQRQDLSQGVRRGEYVVAFAELWR